MPLKNCASLKISELHTLHIPYEPVLLKKKKKQVLMIILFFD